MCFSKIKNVIDDWVISEKNVKIREREEERFKRFADTLLLLLLGGNFYLNIKTVYSAIIALIITIATLASYYIIENHMISRYHYETNELIKKQKIKY